MEPFGARLRDSMDRRGPLCAGIDPHPALLKAWGLSDDPAGLLRFTMTCVEAFSAELAVLKPQSAFFERHGAAGIGVLEQAVRAARAEGALVLLDAKRGDMEYTMRGYADAYLDQSSPLAVDAMTVSPFLGFGSLAPVMRTAQQHGAGVFVLALTSNPEAAQVQHARAGTGTVSGEMLAAIRSSNDGVLPMGSVGAVVGANLAELHEDLAINGPLLAPGLGAQGGTPDDILRIFAGVTDFVLPSSSRGLLQHGPQVGALREAAARTNDELVKALAS